MEDISTAHFKVEEFMCNCGCGVTKPSSELMSVLQLVRLHFNKPVIVTSSYRCPKHNKAVGGASKSKHLEGIAADIQVKDTDPMEVYHFLDSIFPSHYGIGSYKTFTHIDVRSSKARW